MKSVSSQQFVSQIRNVLSRISELVRDSYRNGLLHDGEWPEEQFFAALVSQGLRGGDKEIEKLLAVLNSPGSLRLKIDSIRHNQQCMEPLTGADLAVAVQLVVDGNPLPRRGFLVQLKKSKSGGRSSKLIVDSLHHKSGEKYYLQNLHQAERMMLFTSAAVYWIAVPHTAVADTALMAKHADVASFRARQQSRNLLTFHSASSNAYTSLFGEWPLISARDPEIEYIIHRLRKLYINTPKNLFEEMLNRRADRLQDDLLRTLRADAANEANRVYGSCLLLTVLTVHADSVLSLAGISKPAVSDVYDHAVSLPEFILGDVLGNDFGDDNPEFVESILNNKPNAYIHSRVRSINRKTEVPKDIPLAREALSITLTMRTTDPDRG